MSDTVQTQMQCMEVWGGSQMTEQSVTFSGLNSWVYSKPYGGAKQGGDIYYASSCATGRISRLLLADVSGHGQKVASVAADLRTLMRRFVNRLDQTEFVQLMNQQFASLYTEAIFATALVTTFFSPTARLTLCNAGHPCPLLYRKREKKWSLLSHETSRDGVPSNLPLGILDITSYEQFDLELEPGDCVMSYTDALVEARDADGRQLSEEGLLRIVRLLGDVPPERFIPTLLREIDSRYQDNLADDDVTVLLVQASGSRQQHSVRDKVRAGIRLAGSLVRSLHPDAERAPLPEPTLANIGGAIIPALNRFWRARK
jgi:serine phosphatase RsbU (regulator of sigma subunit)